MNYRICLILSALVLSQTALAQETWTLERCIEYAWSNNLSIKQQNIEVSRSEAQLLQDKLDFAPSLNVSFG